MFFISGLFSKHILEWSHVAPLCGLRRTTVCEESGYLIGSKGEITCMRTVVVLNAG
jgi:hypothetical protein